MCADTEETGSGFKRTVPKVETRPLQLSENDNCRVVYTGSGESSFVDALINEMWQAVPKRKGNLAEIVGKMNAALTGYYRKTWSIYPKQIDRSELPWADLMFAVWTPGETGLFLARSYDITPISTYATIGCGEELSKYICDPLFNSGLVTEMITLLAAFMLYETKRHVPGCGGESHIVILSNDGSLTPIPPFNAESISNQINAYNKALQHMPLAYANETITDEQFKIVFEMVMGQLMATRGRFAKTRQEFWDEVNQQMQRIRETAPDIIKRSMAAGRAKQSIAQSPKPGR
jgi:hypothetical protein